MVYYQYDFRMNFKDPMVWALALVMSAAYVIVGYAGVALIAFPPGNLTPVWFASGVGFLLVYRYRWLGMILTFLMSQAVNAPLLLGSWGEVSTPSLVIVILFSGLVDTAQGILATSFIRQYEQYCERALFTHSRDLFPFVWRVCVLPSAITVWIFPVMHQWAGLTDHSLAQMSYRIWTLTSGDAMGLFVVAPLAWFSAHKSFHHHLSVLIGALALLLVPLALSYWWHAQALVLLIPIFIVVLKRLRWQGAVLAMMGIAPLLYWMAANQTGFFSHAEIQDALWMSHLVIFSIGVGAHYLGLMFSEAKAATAVLEQRVLERTSELEIVNVKLRQLATLDDLTQISNRRDWRQQAEAELAKAKRYRLPMSVLLMDLDHFKKVNDRYGHAAGDDVLLEFVARIAQNLRESDVLGRYGGEEFVVLLPNTELDQAMRLAERLKQAINAEWFRAQGVPVAVTVSIGATTRLPEDNIDRLLQRADIALYDAKAKGRNRVVSNIEPKS